MSYFPAGTIVFTGFGDAGSMRYFSPAGVNLGQPASAIDPGSGVDGICTLLPSGRVALVGGNSPNFGTTGVGILEADLSVRAQGLSSGGNQPSHGVHRDEVDRFYGIRDVGGATGAVLFRYDVDGNPTTFSLGLVDTRSIGVNAAGTIAYYGVVGGGGVVTEVYAWDLSGNASLGLFATAPASFRLRNSPDICVLSTGDVLIAWDRIGAGDDQIYRYSSAGSVLSVYHVDDLVVGMTQGLTSATFWANYYSNASVTSSGVTCAEIDVATGAVLQSFDPEDGSFEFDCDITVLVTAVGTPPGPVVISVPNPTPGAPQTQCTPQAEVGNGGKGASGCNTGGVGRVQQYYGPFDVAPVHADPVEGETLSGKEHLGLEPYIEIVHTEYPSNAVTTYRRALVELAHDPAFDGGRKTDGLLAIGDIEHALGNEQGGIEAATVDLELTDVRDRLIRDLLDTQELAGDELRIKLGTDAGAKAGTPAQVLMRARIESATLGSGLSAQLTAIDELFAEGGPFGPSAVFPQWTYGDLGTSAPTMTADTKGTTIPVLYGEKSDIGAVDPITNASRVKGLLPGVFLGRFDIPATAAIVAATPATTGKTLAQVVAELQASVTAGTTNADWGAIIGVSDAAALEALGTVPDTYNVLASVIGFADLDALLAMGTTPPPVSTEWGVLSFGLGAFFEWLSVHASDLGNGDPAMQHDRTTLDLATRAGSDILVPGWPNWPLSDDFISFTNPATARQFDLACILVRGPLLDDHLNGVVNITANAIGRMGQNGLPIVDAHAIEQVWFEDDILNQWTSGAVVSDSVYPRWADGTPKVRSSTFADRQAYTARKVGGRGLIGAWYVDKPTATVQVAADLARWTESKTGIDHNGQILKSGIDDSISTAAWPRLYHELDLFGPFQRTAGEDRENVTSGSCDWDPDKEKFRVGPLTDTNQTAIDKFKGRRKPGTPIANALLVEEAHLLWTLQARATRLGLGTTLITVTARAGWMDYKLGTGVLFNSIEGPGVNGYVDHPFLILRRRYNFARALVTLTLWDVNGILLETRFTNGASRRFLVTDDSGLAPSVSDSGTVAPLVLL